MELKSLLCHYFKLFLCISEGCCRKFFEKSKRLWIISLPYRQALMRLALITGKKLRPASAKGYFLYSFFLVTAILFSIKEIHPEWSDPLTFSFMEDCPQKDTSDTILLRARWNDSIFQDRIFHKKVLTDGFRKPHKIYSVPSYKATFPDMNDVQLATAIKLGVHSVKDRTEAALRKDELVYVGYNPFYKVKRLTHSVPYLVPRAARLLEYIGRTYLDSLSIKSIPWNKIIVTSLLRTEDDVTLLRRYNQNASEQSCHQYGTTFDISYNKYQNVYDPSLPEPKQVRNDTLKWILSEVLRDARNSGLCFVKYEVKQGCFHITAR